MCDLTAFHRFIKNKIRIIKTSMFEIVVILAHFILFFVCLRLPVTPNALSELTLISSNSDGSTAGKIISYKLSTKPNFNKTQTLKFKQ